jgi:hypothetical protein
MDRDRMLLLGVAGGVAALLGWSILGQKDPNGNRGGRPPRTPGTSAILGASLDVTGGMMTPDHLAWFGPSGPTPQHYQPHRMQYPLTPGMELSRLIYGAPGACNVTTAAADRGWLFAPPSEADF